MPIVRARSFQYQIRLARFPVDAQLAQLDQQIIGIRGLLLQALDEL